MSGRPKALLVLSESEREQLVALTMRRKTAQAMALRARIVLACADGADNKAVAVRQRVTPQTVSKWRARFVEQPQFWLRKGVSQFTASGSRKSHSTQQ
jgi:hypothetical protein